MIKKKHIKYITIILFMAVFAISCVKKIGKLPVAEVAPPPPVNFCDSATYALKINQILTTKCALGGCHDNASSPGQPHFTSYGVASTQAARIKARALDVGGGMPQAPAPGLTQTEKDYLKCWIDNGTPQ